MDCWTIESDAIVMSTDALQKTITKLKKLRSWNVTAQMLEAMSAEQTEAIAENLNARCKSHKRGQQYSSQGNRSTTFRQVWANRMSDNNAKTGGLLVVKDNEKDQIRILPDSFHERQPSAMRTVRPCGQKPSAESNERTWRSEP